MNARPGHHWSYSRNLTAGAVVGIVGLTALAGVVAAPDPAHAFCSVFDRHPCAPTVCSVFRRGPCIPETQYPIGQDLRLTIESARTEEGQTVGIGAAAASHAVHDSGESEHKLDSIADLFAALRACWMPPPIDEASPGMEMSVRFAFKSTGEIIGTPRVTYVKQDTPADVRDRYHTAITEALERCSPMPFTKGMGGAVAGRPIAIRYVDNRSKP